MIDLKQLLCRCFLFSSAIPITGQAGSASVSAWCCLSGVRCHRPLHHPALLVAHTAHGGSLLLSGESAGDDADEPHVWTGGVGRFGRCRRLPGRPVGRRIDPLLPHLVLLPKTRPLRLLPRLAFLRHYRAPKRMIRAAFVDVDATSKGLDRF